MLNPNKCLASLPRQPRIPPRWVRKAWELRSLSYAPVQFRVEKYPLLSYPAPSTELHHGFPPQRSCPLYSLWTVTRMQCGLALGGTYKLANLDPPLHILDIDTRWSASDTVKPAASESWSAMSESQAVVNVPKARGTVCPVMGWSFAISRMLPWMGRKSPIASRKAPDA